MAREVASSGVQALIDRLRGEGVEAGEREAERLIADARERARSLIAEAESEARAARDRACAEIDAERAAARDALTVAARDTVLELKAEMSVRFAGQIRRLTARELGDPAFLRRLILEVAGRARPDPAQGPVQVLLPADAVGVEELRLRPEEVEPGTLTHFVLDVAHGLLRDGVEVVPGGHAGPGIRVRLVEQDVEIDLTEKAVASLLLRHLLPRFRALLDGLVR